MEDDDITDAFMSIAVQKSMPNLESPIAMKDNNDEQELDVEDTEQDMPIEE